MIESPSHQEKSRSDRDPSTPADSCHAEGRGFESLQPLSGHPANDEIAFLLGHRDANVTRAVYVRELADTRRRKMRRSRMIAEYGDLLKP
jgi:integrase